MHNVQRLCEPAVSALRPHLLRVPNAVLVRSRCLSAPVSSSGVDCRCCCVLTSFGVPPACSVLVRGEELEAGGCTVVFAAADRVPLALLAIQVWGAVRRMGRDGEVIDSSRT